jgi:hypothetical protein
MFIWLACLWGEGEENIFSNDLQCMVGYLLRLCFFAKNPSRSHSKLPRTTTTITTTINISDPFL